MVEGKDFIVIRAEGWKELHKWYKGGPPIARKVSVTRIIEEIEQIIIITRRTKEIIINDYRLLPTSLSGKIP